MTPPVVTTADVAGRLDWLAVAEAIAAGHRRPPAAVGDVFLRDDADTLMSRAARVPGLGWAAKTFTVVPENAARGLPSVQGALLLFAEETGSVEAVIDSGLVTRWKTAADSLLGARLLARPDARRLLVVGAGDVAGRWSRRIAPGFRELRSRSGTGRRSARRRWRRKRVPRWRATWRRLLRRPISSPVRRWRPRQ